jgi:hypothetical protein
MVTMLAVSVWPPILTQFVAEDGGDADHAAGQDGAVRRLEARVERGEIGRQVSLARQREDLARIAQDDAVEGRDQPEQAEPHQHVQPVAVLADDDLHRLRQRVVDVGSLVQSPAPPANTITPIASTTSVMMPVM